MKIILIIFILNIGLIQINALISPIVETKYGKIQGKIYNNYIGYHAVPYAQPPINENRFELPKPLEKNWTETLDGTKMANGCMQWNHFIFQEDRLTGHEDCLYLNIYVPVPNELSTESSDEELLPVIIFIHGGAFQYGTGNIFGPELIMKNENAIMVTIAYRLGPLGFLSTEDEEISGNLGLKDQQLGLKWVKENIQNFGGDPNHITLTGFSAGGASVHFHLLTDNIENLITNAISFSGTVFCPWVIVNNPMEQTKKVASIVDCPWEDTKLLKKCLKEKPAEDIVRTVGHFQFSQYFPFRVFGPVIEPKSVQNTFLNENPEILMKSNKIKNIPWMIAFTEDDGGYSAGDLMTKSETVDYLEEFWKNFNEYASKALFYGERFNEKETADYSKFLIQKFNIKDDDTKMEKYFKIQKIFTRELFAQCSIKAMKLQKDFGNSSVYGYVYDNPSIRGVANLISQRDDINFGCTHGDDVFLMFTVPHRIHSTTYFRDDEIEFSNKFLQMLNKFSRTGLAKFGDVDFPVNKKSEKVKLLKITQTSTSTVEYDEEE